MKKITIPLSIVGLLAITLIGYGELKNKVSTNTVEIKEVEEVVKENTEDIDKEENINISQTVLLEQLCISVKRLNDKMANE